MTTSVKVLRKHSSLAEAEHTLTRLILSDAGNDPFFESPTQADVHAMLTTYSKKIIQYVRADVSQLVEEEIFWNGNFSEAVPG